MTETVNMQRYEQGKPYFDELAVGDVFQAPALTVTEGHMAVHQAILGDRLATALDRDLGQRVFRTQSPPAFSGLVIDIGIGQSSVVTGRVKANLFYRGLALHRTACLGDTLRTTTEIAALRQNRLREDRPSTGLAVLHIKTVDQSDRPILDFHRCAMLPLRDPMGSTDHNDDLDAFSAEIDMGALQDQASSWDLVSLGDMTPGPHASDLRIGQRWTVDQADVVSAAPELARLTLNVAAVHHDEGATPDGRRLVYGGHTIGLAASQAMRCLPGMASVVAWRACDHTAPVWEGDNLVSELEVTDIADLGDGGALVDLHSRVRARRSDGDTDVLDWRFLAVVS